jgi:hypothetical protein
MSDDSEKQQVTTTAGAPDMLTASKWSRNIRQLIFFVWSQAKCHHNFSLVYIPILPITKWEVHEHCTFTLNKDPIIKLRPQPEFSTWLWRSRPTIYKRQMVISEEENQTCEWSISNVTAVTMLHHPNCDKLPPGKGKKIDILLSLTLQLYNLPMKNYVRFLRDHEERSLVWNGNIQTSKKYLQTLQKAF